MCEQRPAIEVSPSSLDQGKCCPCFTVFIRVLLKYLKSQGDLEAYGALQRRVDFSSISPQSSNLSFPNVAKEILQDIPKIVKASDLHRVRSYLRLRVQQKKRLRTKQSPGKTTSIPCTLFDIVHEVTE